MSRIICSATNYGLPVFNELEDLQDYQKPLFIANKIKIKNNSRDNYLLIESKDKTSRCMSKMMTTFTLSA